MVIIFGFLGKKYLGKSMKTLNIDRQSNRIDPSYLREMYVFKGFKFVINLLLYVFLNLNFKLHHVDFYYLWPIATTILMLNLKVNLKYINKINFKSKRYVLYCR